MEALESRDLLSTFTVINTSSDPNTSGSLPWAVQQANSSPGLNYIEFNIPGSGIHTINISSTLSLTNQVVIDGTSQPGYNGTPLISVQGSANVLDLFELGTNSSDSTIQGLDMYDYTGSAVALFGGSTGDFIQNNWIGFFRDPTTGEVSLNYNLGQDNSSEGIVVSGSNNNVIRNNVIDGTGSNGISVVGFGGSAGFVNVIPCVDNSIVANCIGTDPSGSTAVGYGNQGNGIFLGQACQNTQIAGNVISGNTGNGIQMVLDNSFLHYVFLGDNVISGNKIGTDVSGSFAIPNGTGITIFGAAASNTIDGNTISGNLNVGISLGLAGFGPGNSNWIQGNIIGLNASQTAVISPGAYGISINNGSQGNVIQSNVIAGASVAGVVLSNATGNAVNQNWIGQSAYGQGFANGSYGVELLASANDNSVLQNAFGPNGIGSIYVDPNAVGNELGYTPQPTLSSIRAQIQQLFGYAVQLVQAAQTGNASGFVPALQSYVSLYVTVELELLNYLLRI
ncbi:MAG TPA: right-handed parallel beta-helix repeat-containing protein [Gemmataceae bacterium]|nr:right-handed parallel beta-helix repeat-containing protein [Gemmataceae bacterium]